MQREHRGGGVIVDRRGALGARESAKPFPDGVLAGRTLACLDVQLEVEIATGRLRGGLDGLIGQRGPAEVGVKNDTGSIEDTPKPGTHLPGETEFDSIGEQFRSGGAVGGFAAAQALCASSSSRRMAPTRSA